MRFWFWFSLFVVAVYGYFGLEFAFRDNYIVDSDARQHVFWMQRFLDPELFPNDWIADYHEFVAPAGYSSLYWIAAKLGIPPLFFNKILPPILGLITTAFCFKTSLYLFPYPAAAFTSSVLLNQILWTKYDIISGTARAFIYPLFLAFLYFLLRRSLLGTTLTIALTAVFYPQSTLVCSGVLILLLLRWDNRRLQLNPNRQDLKIIITGVSVAFVILLTYLLRSPEFGPAISAEVARQSPEFLPDGRTPFFHDNPWEFWLYGNRSGILPKPWLPPIAWLGLLLPWLMRHPSRFVLLEKVRDGIGMLPRIAIASLGMFAIAHLFLFRLHLPSRYTMHSLRIVLSLSAGIAILALLEAGLHASLTQSRPWQRSLAIGGAFLWGIWMIFYPLTPEEFPYHKYKEGEEEAIYEFLQQQPKDTLIASISEKANYLPTFAKRLVLTSEMYAIAYHVGYYNKIRQRTLDIVRAQYSPQLDPAVNLIREYGVNYWLLDRVAFTPPYLSHYDWLMQYEETRDALQRLQQGIVPALSTTVERCTILASEEALLLDANCIAEMGERQIANP